MPCSVETDQLVIVLSHFSLCKAYIINTYTLSLRWKTNKPLFKYDLDVWLYDGVKLNLSTSMSENSYIYTRNWKQEPRLDIDMYTHVLKLIEIDQPLTKESTPYTCQD